VVGKRRPLKEVFTLRLYSIDLYKVDLSQLLKGDSFTFLYTINSNKLGIKTYALINTKVNRYAFINTEFIALITRFLNTKTQ
jgi:hypothetical protein